MKQKFALMIALLAPMSAPCEAAEPAAKTDAMAAMTGFTWDQVPLNIHFARRDADLTDAEIGFLATHSRLIVLEKGHGAVAHGSTEAGVADTARRLKKRNAKVKALFYLNAFINWPGYESFKTYNPKWTLRDAAGDVVNHRSGTPRPDPSIAEFREWWSNVVADELKRGPIEGVFVDALPQALSPGLAKSIGAEKAKAVIAGLREMIALTKRKIGPEKIVLCNGTRGEDYRQILDWKGIDGVMIEHFASFDSDKPEDIKADMETVALAAAKGKFVVIKGWPGFNFTDAQMMKRPYPELLKLAREQVTFPLACFLVAAQPGSHFCYSWGYTDRAGMLESYPEFERPLGKPLGQAKQNGWSYQREFAHALVSVNLKTKTARIDWKPRN